MPEDDEDPDDGRVSVAFRRDATPYIDTERRMEGIRGSRDCTAEGSIVYSIEASFIRDGRNSADRGRSCGDIALRE